MCDRTGGTSLQACPFPRTHRDSIRVLPGVRVLCRLPSSLRPPVVTGLVGTHSSPSSLRPELAPHPLSSRCPPAPSHLHEQVCGPRAPVCCFSDGRTAPSGSSGCRPVPSLGHSLRGSPFPGTATALACGRVPRGRDGPPSWWSCLLSLSSAARRGVHREWRGRIWLVQVSLSLPREPLQRRGLGPGPHVVQSPTGSYFLPLRLAVRLTAGSLCLYHQGLGWPVSTQTCRRPSPVESGQQLLPAQPHALPPSQAVKLGEWPGLLRPGWPF